MTQASPATESLLLIELRRWSEGLTDAGVEALAAAWEVETEGMTADLVAEFVAERLLADDDPEIDAYRRRISPLQMVGRSPLLGALHRRRSELRPGSCEELHRLWSLDLRKLPAAKIAGEVARRLARPEYARHLRDDDPEKNAEDRVFSVLARFADVLVPDAPLDLSIKWRAELSRYPTAPQIVEAVFQRLAHPAFAGYLKPGHKLPSTGEEALRAALRRYPDMVSANSVEALFNAWKPLFGALPPERVAALVCHKLGAND